MDRITLSMTPADALFALAAIQGAGAKAHAARLGQHSDIAETTAAVYDRLETQLMNLLYPRCDWLGEDECDGVVAGKAENGRDYCTTHLRQLYVQVAQLEFSA